ncbi:MAG: (2Fe-2S)-binding protein [Chloroflexales bacterium]|nr:(2Fe-2S)-binding protein [Chloroflexales bacterium]
MATIQVEGGPTIDDTAGRKLVLAIEDAGVDILHRCGGNAKCTTCRVEVLAGEAPAMQEKEATRLAQEGELAPNTRLSCQIRPTSDLTVRVVYHLSTSGLSDAGPRPEE